MSASDYETAYHRMSRLARATSEALMSAMDDIADLRKERDSLIAQYREARDKLAAAEAALEQCRCRQG